MADDFVERLAKVEKGDLNPLVRAALKNDRADVKEWSYAPVGIGGGMDFGGVRGLFRFKGLASTGDGKQSEHWSMILKAIGANGTGSTEPHAWNYWKREILINQSGLLNALSGALVAPRCYGVVEHPNDEYWIWIQDMGKDDSSHWSMDRYGLAARHLGQFNGQYLSGRDMPSMPWLSAGRVKEWLIGAIPAVKKLQDPSSRSVLRSWLKEDTIDRILRLWSERDSLVAAIERLPRTFCHHDAYRRNLMSRSVEEGREKTVAIDWSIVGTGAVGEEIATLVGISLAWLDADVEDVKELDSTVFCEYLQGLKDAGWNGDRRLVRLGFAASAALYIGISLLGSGGPTWFDSAERNDLASRRFGYPIENILGQYPALQSYLLDLGDEAIALAEDLR